MQGDTKDEKNQQKKIKFNIEPKEKKIKMNSKNITNSLKELEEPPKDGKQRRVSIVDDIRKRKSTLESFEQKKSFIDKRRSSEILEFTFVKEKLKGIDDTDLEDPKSSN